MIEHVAPTLVLSDFLEPPVPVVQVVQVPQVQFIDKTVEAHVSLSGQGTQTSRSLAPAPVRFMKPAEDVVEVWSSGHPSLSSLFLRCA